MMPSTRISISLVTISVSCLGLLLVFCNSGLPQEAKQANARIQELQQKRLKVLEKVCEEAQERYTVARTSFEEVLAANAALSTARIEYANTREDRLKACDEAIKNALEMQDVTAARVKAAHGSRVDQLKADAYVLELQIRREKAAAE
jgi:hypothetical protein